MGLLRHIVMEEDGVFPKTDPARVFQNDRFKQIIRNLTSPLGVSCTAVSDGFSIVASGTS